MNTLPIKNITITNWHKGLRAGGYRVPKNAVSYKVITGVAEKGAFEIYQFKNALGRVVKTCHRYIKKGKELLTIKNYNYGQKHLIEIRETNYENNKEKNFKAKVIAKTKPNAEGKSYIRILEEEKNANGYIHSWRYTGFGEPQQGIKYRYLGYSPYSCFTQIGSKDIGRVGNRELIPVIISLLCSRHNVDEAIETISQYNQKKLDIKGFVNRISRDSLKELNPNTDFKLKEKNRIMNNEKDIDYSDLASGSYYAFTNDVSIYKGYKNILEVVGTVSHEVQHVKDFAMVSCLEDFSPREMSSIFNCELNQIIEFANKARRKFGVIKKTDENYPEYKKIYEAMKTYLQEINSKEGWEVSPVEANTIANQQKMVQLIKDIILDMDNQFVG